MKLIIKLWPSLQKEDVAKLDPKISNTKADVIKSMLICWIGQIAATFSWLLLFLRNKIILSLEGSLIVY